MLEGEDFNKINNNNSSIKTNINSNIKLILSKSFSNINEEYKTKNKIENENKWEKILLKYFTTINSIDNSIEKIRKKLNYINNFSSLNLFNYLDKKSKKFLTLNDFKNFLQNSKIPFSEKNLRKFIHNFDKDNDFSLDYKEFLGVISSKYAEIKIKNEYGDKIQNNNGEIIINDEIKKVFGELIIEELNFVEKCYELSQNMINSKDFTTYEAFTAIVGEEKYINVKNLGKYLKNKGLNMTDLEINQLMFRIDSDNDGRISYEEFKEIFLPLNDNNFKYDINIYENDNNYDNLDKYYKYNYNYDKNDNQFEQKEKKYNNDFTLKKSINQINSDLYNNNENKENNKNDMNIKLRYNYHTNIKPIDIKNKKIIYEPEPEDFQNMSNMSYSLYEEKLKNNKSITIDTQNKGKDKDKEKNKKINERNSLDIKINQNNTMDNYYKKSNNNLLYETQSILNYNINNNNKSKDIIYNYKEKNYSTNISINKNDDMQYNNINNINNNQEKFLDTNLNFDYSRSTNKDKDNGQYYFRNKNKSNSLENKIKSYYNKEYYTSQNKNDIENNLIKKSFNTKYLKTNNNNAYDSEYYLENINIYENEKNNNNESYNLNNLIYFQKEKENDENKIEKNNYLYTINKNIKYLNKSSVSGTNKNYSQISPISHYKVMNNYNKYILNNNYSKKINQKSNNYISHDEYLSQKSIEQQYLDSLENSGRIGKKENSKIIKKSKNKYHYNIKLTRNLKDQLYNRINSSYRMDNDKDKDNINNSRINYNYKEKEKENKKNTNNIYKTYFEKEERKTKNNNKNRSFILPYNNDHLFDIKNKYNNENIDNSNFIKINKNKQVSYNNSYAERCRKCKCYMNDNNVPGEDVNLNNLEYNYKNNNIYNKINNTNINENNINSRHSSLPKNIKKKSNVLNLNYNTSTKTKSYYLEGSYNSNNLIINKIDNNNNITNLNKKELNDINKYISFYNLLNDFIKQDSAINNIRQSLSIQEDFNLTDLFELFDQSSKKLISSEDFLQTLKKFGLFLNYEDISYIFRKFNKNLEDFFAYEEFCEIFLPKKYSSAKIMNEKEENKDFYEITEETKNIICLLFKKIIEGGKSNENYRKIIKQNDKYSGFDLFNKIKKSYSIGIYKEDISNFMKKNKHILTSEEIELLMERFDKNKDGMIDYKEFLNEIFPMNN